MGGRKPILLQINSEQSYIIGIDIGAKHIRFALGNLSGKIICYQTIKVPLNISEDDLIQSLIKQVYVIMDESAILKEKVVGIGIGVNGNVENESGMITYSSKFELHKAYLKQEIENEFHIKVKVENSARAMALGEQWFGVGKGFSNLLCINVGYDVCAGLIINNQLVKGKHNLAGNIGHMVIDLNGPVCSCGQVGCLKAFICHDALKRMVLTEVYAGRNTSLIECMKGDMEKISGKIIQKAAKKGDSLSIELLKNIGQSLGVACTNMINIFNPDIIIIGGGIGKADEFYMDELKKVVRQRLVTTEGKETEIVASKLGDKATVIGAITLIITELYEMNSTP
ncbi:ROK family protein [Bacillus carboniphilus]|uniref:ROK family protein n=1 Tax=Bacillus carboniphilus TaxID=86663 RepID=A0ABY9JVK6_9BACI|nr:ROK family protein [Bacillus carboniphilus]WLR42824.1 ROK family protein [Bacillus carboniphilus]